MLLWPTLLQTILQTQALLDYHFIETPIRFKTGSVILFRELHLFHAIFNNNHHANLTNSSGNLRCFLCYLQSFFAD